MSDIADRADRTRTFDMKEVSPNCTRCSLECHGHYPHKDHETDQHARWLEGMIATFS